MEHHAYLYVGTDIGVLPESAATPGVDTEHILTDRFAIDDARQLKEIAYRRPQEAQIRQLVLVVQDIPVEAQNALLKLFEEPPADCVFHIVVPRRDMLIPTLLSRVCVVGTNIGGSAATIETALWLDFQNAAYKDRLQQIESAQKSSNKKWFTDLFNATEEYATTIMSSNATLADHLLRQCIAGRGTGASRKMVAEEIALSVPVA